MYTLQVFYDGALRHTERLTGGANVLARIPELLRAHEGCEKIVIAMEGVRLFAVDCEGRRLDD